MGTHATFNKKVEIYRPLENENDNQTTNYNLDESAESKEIIFNNYHCRITENIRYSTGKEGSQYQGSIKMVGLLTNLLQEGDIVADKYKIIGEPELRAKQRATVCNMVRL